MSFSSAEESHLSHWSDDILYGRKSHISEYSKTNESKTDEFISPISSKKSESSKLQNEKLTELEEENEALRKMLESHQNAIINFQKSTTKAEELKKENEVLQENLIGMIASKSAAEFHLQQKQKEQRSAPTPTEKQHTTLQVDNAILKQQLQLAQRRIIELEDNYGKATKDAEYLQREHEKNKNEVRRLNRQQQETMDSDIYNRERDLLYKTQKEVEEQTILIFDYQKQFKALAKVLDLKLTGNNHDDWKSIIDTVVEYKYIAGRVSQLEKENQRLSQDNKIAVDELTLLQNKQQSEKSSVRDENVKEILQQMLHNERKINEENMQLIEKLREKSSYSTAIENALHYTVKQINDLHSAINNQYQGGLKTLIFTVILARQFTAKDAVLGGVNGINAMLGSKRGSTLEGKIKNLRVAYSRMTEDLILAKADLERSEEKRRVLKGKVSSYKQMTITNTDSTSKYEKKFRAMKKKVEDLQKELDSMVSPALYENTVKSLENENKKTRELQETIAALEEKQRKLELNLNDTNKTREDSDIRLNTAKTNIKKLQDELDAANKNNYIMQRIIRAKSKEILSLERVVARNEATQSTKDNEFRLLAGKESEKYRTNTITFDPYSFSNGRLNSQSGTNEKISRAFICK